MNFLPRLVIQFAICCFILIDWCSFASARLVLNVGDVLLNNAGTGVVSVSIDGDADLVAAYQIELQILPVNTVVSALQFTEPQSADFRSSPDYLFADDSANVQFDIDPRTVFTTTLQNDSVFDSDLTASGTARSVDRPMLLGDFNISHILPAGTDHSDFISDQFRVEVRTASTLFLDENNDLVDFIVGRIGVISFQSVPEPSSALYVLASVLVLACTMKRKKSDWKITSVQRTSLPT